MKPLIYLFVAISIAACAVLAFEKCAYPNRSNTCNPVYTTLEIHCDRPLHDVIQEIVRDNESTEARVEREVAEMCSTNEWDAMS